VTNTHPQLHEADPLASLREAVRAAHAARAAAHAKLEAAGAALARGQEAAVAAQSELSRLEAEEAEWISRDASRRVERAVAGAGPAPALVPADKAFLS
jgi:hypothetical protein